MESRDLQTFLAVAECGSITRAAELLGRSQPHVTRTIQELEAELGFDLLHRVGRRIMLSEQGHAFEGEARRMLTAFAGLAERARSIAAGRGRILEIAATSAIATALIPEALAGMDEARLPEIHLAQLLPNTVSQEVRSGQAEIGFSSMPLDTPGLAVLRLYAAPDVAALHRDDPLARLDVVPLQGFAGRRMVTMLDPLRFQRQVLGAMTARGIAPASVMRTNVATTALHLVRRTRAVAVVDPVTAWTIDVPEVAIRPIDAAVPFRWGAIAARGRPLRPLVHELVEAVEAVALRRLPGLSILDPAQAGELAAEAPMPHMLDRAGAET